MKDLTNKISEWEKEGKKIALATLVKVYGSAPEPLGAAMVVNDTLEFEGSVSGGCVEGDIIRQSMDVIRSGEPRLIEYGISNDTAWEIGLSCGGNIEVFLEPLNQVHAQMRDLIQAKKFFTQAIVLTGTHKGKEWIIHPAGETDTSVDGEPIPEALIGPLQTAMDRKKPFKTTIQMDGEETDVFLNVFPPPARMLIIGAVQIAIPLIGMAKQFGFETYVIDARKAFATHERFPHTDHLFQEWPAEALKKMDIDENTFIVILSHDEKMDNPALIYSLESKARYIGILGSRKTHARRVEALRAAGVRDEQINRIHAPIGLKIGAVGAEQIALSIMAEIVAEINSVAIS